MTICTRIFDEMAVQGLSASDLARALGNDPRVVGNWKRRDTDPPMMYVLKIADFLNHSVEWLLTGEDPADPGQKETAPAPVLDDRSRELLEIFGSLDDFDQGRLMERAKDLKEAASKKQERASRSVSGSLAG